ncbi:MAG: amidohydrolase family protein [Gemmatimonadota bacterium]|uniref:amidohydrolase family protein n=1 Tax=Candidatus Palauibacter scopulicola TaxID=3056741 RepID=UPI00238D6D22|nr:amidohydrolase family protein [Candidatus Palauibacter scopulicola]MDE2662488.1 amidohydrolase family protein [Candidatus Palauibacter scopulicola]
MWRRAARRPLAWSAAMVLCVLAAPLAGQSRSGEPPRNPNAESETTIYEGVAILDGTGAPLMRDMSIVVRDGRIAALAPTDGLSLEDWPEAEAEDARGLYVIPGLIESHTHLATRADRAAAEFELNRFIYGGVTTVRDMAGDVRALAELQRAALVGEIPAPDIHYAALVAGESFFVDPRTRSSSMGEVPGRVPWLQIVDDETDLAETIALARGTWATGLKTYASIEGPLLARIAAEARRQGMPVWSHTHVGPALPMDVARAGVTSMSHVCSLASTAIPDEVMAEALAGRRSGRVDVDLDDPRIDAVLEEMKRQGTVLDATLKVGFFREQMTMARDSAAAPPAPPAPRPDAPRPDAPSEGPDAPPPDPRRRGVRAACSAEESIGLTRRAHEAGVLIAAGTDAPPAPGAEWPALYEELAYFHERVGMPMADVIQTATRNGALTLGLEGEIGTVEEGKYANLVFLEADPTAGVENLKSIRFTLKRGGRFDRDEFELGTQPSRRP